jgi:hypothetical protein
MQCLCVTAAQWLDIAGVPSMQPAFAHTYVGKVENCSRPKIPLLKHVQFCFVFESVRFLVEMDKAE